MALSSSIVKGKHTEPEDIHRVRDPDEAWSSSFIAMHAQTCVAQSLIHDVSLIITNTTFSGVSGVAAYNSLIAKSYVYADDPESLAMCEATQTDRVCPDPSLYCMPTDANGTDSIPDDLQFLEAQADWPAAVLKV